jgi:hypothetical protein
VNNLSKRDESDIQHVNKLFLYGENHYHAREAQFAANRIEQNRLLVVVVDCLIEQNRLLVVDVVVDCLIEQPFVSSSR